MGKAFIYLLAALLLCQPIRSTAETAEIDARVVKSSVEGGMVDLSVRLFRPFDWKKATYFSKKTFPVDGPPGAPEPQESRYELNWRDNGRFEWTQSDFIEVGTSEFKGDFTVEAQTLGGRVLLGVFDPVSNVLLFEGLEYVAGLPIPEMRVSASNDLIEWSEVDELEEVAQEFTWSDAVSISFRRKEVPSEYYRVRVGTGVPSPVVTSDEEPDLLQLDGFSLREVSLEGCKLTIDVTYSGGCREHEFQLFMSPSVFAESAPVQASLWLQHNGNGDICRALISETLEFDISPVIEQHREQFGRDDEIILNVHGYFADRPGPVIPVRYTP
ncbi:MAG: hypothetical protein P8J87_14100 [Verrucomicrobiales bacterium]|nr:hypothetical protein [Verrucomicrobiales bacterium]